MKSILKKREFCAYLLFAAQFMSIFFLLSLPGLAESKNSINDDLNNSSLIADLGFALKWTALASPTMPPIKATKD